MRAGRLRHKITIEHSSEVRDGRGETTKTWSTFATPRAGIYPQSGGENFQLHQENNSVSHKIVTRYMAGITPDMRVSYNGRVFDIESVINVGERNKMLHIWCKERFS